MRVSTKALATLVALAMLSCAQQAKADPCATESNEVGVHHQSATGEWLLKLNQNQLEVYVFGFAGALWVSPFVGVKSECLDRMWNCTKDKSFQQLAAIVRKEIQGKPEAWHWPANVLVYNALYNAQSCVQMGKGQHGAPPTTGGTR
jgi:hypothetical protein